MMSERKQTRRKGVADLSQVRRRLVAQHWNFDDAIENNLNAIFNLGNTVSIMESTHL